MKRLTTNKATAEMSILELAHNCCYVDSENNARYRDLAELRERLKYYGDLEAKS